MVRYLSIDEMSHAPEANRKPGTEPRAANAGLPARPLIGLLLRLVYQQYAQAIDAALREAGFDDMVGSSRGRVSGTAICRRSPPLP